MNTTRHNAACRLSDKRIKAGTLGKWLILRNFGRTDDEPEEKTIPDWMLPPGHGVAHNKPDFVIVKGWPRHSPPPLHPYWQVPKVQWTRMSPSNSFLGN